MTERDSGIPFDRSSATADAIEASIHHLPEDLREALLLTSARGLAVAEVASILDIPEATLRQRVDEARNCIRRALAEHEDLPLAEDTLVTAVDAAVRRMTGAPADSSADPQPRRLPLGERLRGWLRPRAAAHPAAAQPLGWRPAVPWLVPALGTGVAVLLLAIALPPLLPPAADDAVGVPRPNAVGLAGLGLGLEGIRADIHLATLVEETPPPASAAASAFELASREHLDAVEWALNASEAGALSDFARAVEQANEALERAWDAAAPAGVQRPATVSVTAEPLAGDLLELVGLIGAYGSTPF